MLKPIERMVKKVQQMSENPLLSSLVGVGGHHDDPAHLRSGSHATPAAAAAADGRRNMKDMLFGLTKCAPAANKKQAASPPPATAVVIRLLLPQPESFALSCVTLTHGLLLLLLPALQARHGGKAGGGKL